MRVVVLLTVWIVASFIPPLLVLRGCQLTVWDLHRHFKLRDEPLGANLWLKLVGITRQGLLPPFSSCTSGRTAHWRVAACGGMNQGGVQFKRQFVYTALEPCRPTNLVSLAWTGVTDCAFSINRVWFRQHHLGG